MQATIQADMVSPNALWAGWVISLLPVLFLLFDGIMKLIKPSFVVLATVQLGYPESVIVPLGIALTCCTLIYVVPRISVLGAVLLTGYLGGAVATQLRAKGGAFPILFPAILGMILWAGLYLREPQLRTLVPIKSERE